MDMMWLAYRRNLEIIGEKGMILWDFNDHSVTFYDDEKKRWEISKEDKTKVFKNLEAYCELDTQAMIDVLKVLKNVI